jgi:uracil-DNA glycosylase family 4
VLGRFAAQSVLHTDAPISALRGRVHRLCIGGRELPAIVSYHPAYLLRNLADKAKSWADLCLALEVGRGEAK